MQDMEYGKKLKIMENEKHALDNLKNEETLKNRKLRNAHCMTGMGEKTENHGK